MTPHWTALVADVPEWRAEWGQAASAVQHTRTGTGDPFLDADAALANALGVIWPHLYAAALRHAADRADSPGEFGPAYHAVDTLRRWADEATQ